MLNDRMFKKVCRLFQAFAKRDHRCRRKLRSWEDFKRVPIVKRDDIKAFIKEGLVCCPYNIAATSGSTSSRMIVVHSRDAYEAHLRRLVKLYRYAGVKEGMLCLNLCAYELNSGGRLMEAAFKAARVGVIPFGPVSTREKILEAVDVIKVLKPGVINAYTNQLFDLFSILKKKHPIRQCIVNGEPLWDDYRNRVESMGGIQIHDHYGAMEISGLAIAVDPHDEYMRIVSDGLLIEVLADSGDVSETGKGKLLVTDTDNVSMPFIRYCVGDEVEVLRRKGALWMKVLGRAEDSVLINGVVVQKKELIRAANSFLGHPNFFFVIDKDPLRYDDTLIINVVNEEFEQTPELIESVVQSVGLDRCISVRVHRGIVPRTSNGKIRYFVDARKRSGKIRS